MTPDEARTARMAYLRDDSHSREMLIRRWAEILAQSFDPLKHVVEQRNVPWLSPLANHGYSNPTGGGTLALPSPAIQIRVFIPGSDFAAQLVVEQQIRDQLGYLTDV